MPHEVPVAKLTSKDYAARLRESIQADRASASKDIRPGELLVAVHVPAESAEVDVNREQKSEDTDSHVDH